MCTLGTRVGGFVAVVATLVIILSLPASASGISVSWTRQFGTQQVDTGEDVVADATGYSVVGTTYRSLAGPHLGYSDAYIRHYDTSGAVVWERQFGTAHQEYASAIASDPGGFTVVGETDGYFPGYSGKVVLGEPDIFVSRFDRDGHHLWTRQFGTNAEEDATGVFADGTTIVVVGSTGGAIARTKGGGDAIVRCYDPNGEVLWTRQFGTAQLDTALAVSGDLNGYTVGGKTYGALTRPLAGPVGDAFVRRYDRNGHVVWTRQFGQRGDDWVSGIATDRGGITVVGPTRATAGWDSLFDGFIRRYDFDGKLRWRRDFGLDGVADLAYDVTQDGTGLTATGYTFGPLDGKHRGGFDVFVRRYDRSGSLVWRTQFGTDMSEIGMGVAAYGRSFVVAGHTQGSLAARNKGEEDVFIRRYVRG